MECAYALIYVSCLNSQQNYAVNSSFLQWSHAMSETPGKLKLGALIALVVGSMIGGGIFSLPQNMAASADVGAILISYDESKAVFIQGLSLAPADRSNAA